MFEYAKHCGAKKLSRAGSLTTAITYLNRNPLQKKNALRLAEKFKFSEKQTAQMIGMSLRRYRLAAPSAVLHWPAVENVMRLSELYEVGLRTFDSKPMSFITWLNTNVMALNHLKPIQVLCPGIGVEIVRDELLRMEYSVLS